MKSWKDNVSFLLVEPAEPGNIGASARAIKNMGFKGLELVRPACFLTDEARQMACNGKDVLERAVVHSRFEDAIREKSLIVGTTRRIGRERGLILPLKDGVKKIISTAKKNKVSILFGRERNGLTNHEVAACGLMLTILANPAFPSLNLSQAVMLVAYELSGTSYETASPELVKQTELEDLYKHIHSTLRLLEYLPRGDRSPDKIIIRNLKHFIGRSGLTDWELKTIHGLCSQVEKKLRKTI